MIKSSVVCGFTPVSEKPLAYARQLWKIRGLSVLLGLMKKVPFVIMMALITIVGAVMISLLNSGISLRVATLIKPSDFVSTKQVAQAVVVRLFPDLQSKKWMIYEMSPASPMDTELFQNISQEIKNTPVGDYELKTSLDDCGKHCAFVIHNSEHKEMYTQKFFAPLDSPQSIEPEHFRLVVQHFDRTESFIEECETMQRLDEKCIRSLSIRDARRKMKDVTKKYFFLKKYNHNDFFLFLEN